MPEMRVRDYVREAVRRFANPKGITASALAAYLNYTDGSVRSALKRLREDGRVKLVGTKFSARWFPAEYPTEEIAPRSKVVRSRAAVLDAMTRLGRFARLHEIVAATGFSGSAVQVALRELKGEGLVRQGGKANTVHSFWGLPGMVPPPAVKTRAERRAGAQRERARRKPVAPPKLQRRPPAAPAVSTEELIAQAIAEGRVTRCPTAYVAPVNGAEPVGRVPSYYEIEMARYAEFGERMKRQRMAARKGAIGAALARSSQRQGAA